MTEAKVCNSCKTELTNLKGSTTFKCPSCSKGIIVRCSHCRKLGARYICNQCNFTGPN